eukprot:2867919-Amphidinium_carterae.1
MSSKPIKPMTTGRDQLNNLKGSSLWLDQAGWKSLHDADDQRAPEAEQPATKPETCVVKLNLTVAQQHVRKATYGNIC